MTTANSNRHLHPSWIAGAVVVIVIAGLAASPLGRPVVARFIGSLRQQNVQSVNVNLSSFVGPNANHTVQQMISQMIADKVTTTVSGKPRSADTAAQASTLAGFRVQLLGLRKDVPQLLVNGERAFTVTVDRARLQAILKEAGRPDLVFPPSIDGAHVAVTIPPTVRARYGTCPRPPSATANLATPPPTSAQYSDCVLLAESPSPQVAVPPGLDLAPLAQVGLEVAGMTASQARQFLQTVDWKSALAVSLPRSMRSYASVQVNGVKGTLLNIAGRRGPTYTLIWAKSGMVYALTGFGDSLDAVKLADSLT